MLDQYIFHDITFTWLEGDRINLDGGTIFGPVPRAIWGRYFPYNEQNQIPSVNDPILVQYQDKNYLIDTAMRVNKNDQKNTKIFGLQATGDIFKSLAQVGLEPKDIHGVMMTHMHNDHAGGLSYAEGGELKSTYPNATIYIHEKEWTDVKNPSNRTRNTYLKTNWEPIQQQVVTFSDTLEIAPGITMEHTGGHSRGHALIRFQQKDETMLHLADLLITFVHSNPLWVAAVDDYPLDSIAAKEKWMQEALVNHYRFIFYHDPFYRVVEYTEDGKNLAFAMKTTNGADILMTAAQDKTHRLLDE